MMNTQDFINELNHSSLPIQSRQIIKSMLDRCIKRGGMGTRNSIAELQRDVQLTESQILKYMAIAFKARWLACDYYIYGEICNTSECYTIVERPEYRKPKQKKVRAIKANKLMTLEEWETNIGSILKEEMIHDWVKDKNLCPVLIAQMIEEFRLEMLAKNKAYADFRAVFQTYLNRDYLSKRLDQLKLSDRPVQPSHTQVFNRGGMI